MKNNLTSTLDVTSLVAVAALLLCACSRASSPAPASESAAKPPMTAAPPPDTATAPPPPAAPASQSAATPPPTATPAPSPTPTPAPGASVSAPSPDDCTRFDTSPEFRDLPPEDRARSRLTCEAKEELRSFVSTRQACSTAADCEYVTGSCPFGCTIPASKSAASAVAAKVASLGERLDKAGHRCVYRCMAPGAPACVAGRCAAGAR